MISANLSATFYLISGVLFILALRVIFPKHQDKGTFWYSRNDNCNISTFLLIGNFSKDLFSY